jgi:hypothetical protein
MRIGVPASVFLHAAALGLAFFSLPSSWRTPVVSEPVVPIDIISKAELAELTSVPAAAPKPKPEPEIKPDPPAPKVEEKPAPKVEEPPPPEPKPELKPEPVKPDIKPEAKVEPPQEKPKPKPKPKPKEDELDFDRLAALVDKERQNQQPSDPSQAAVESERPQERVGPGDRLTASDIAKMQAAVSRCWQTQALIGAPEPEKLLVQLEIELGRDGRLVGQPRVVNGLQISLSGNQFWKVAEQVAIRAVISCQPYDFLAADRYAVWKEMQLNFDPRVMAGF